MVKTLILNQIALLLKRFDYHIIHIDLEERKIYFRRRKGNVWVLSISREEN